jgi:regulator of replication initiation timing
MEALTILILLIGVVALATFHWTAKQERDMYKELYDETFSKTTILIRENANLKMENMRLKDHFVLNRIYKQTNKPVADKDMVEAVKYAMKKAHPDNGGKQEDFIKFNNLYNKIR